MFDMKSFEIYPNLSNAFTMHLYKLWFIYKFSSLSFNFYVQIWIIFFIEFIFVRERLPLGDTCSNPKELEFFPFVMIWSSMFSSNKAKNYEVLTD